MGKRAGVGEELCFLAEQGAVSAGSRQEVRWGGGGGKVWCQGKEGGVSGRAAWLLQGDRQRQAGGARGSCGEHTATGQPREGGGALATSCDRTEKAVSQEALYVYRCQQATGISWAGVALVR